ncbi:MAG: hypothetical protein ABS46_00405 [Cytophagaceae bacterium SCN 52-12]|nr:MAG: hypothetical protein ABS46_00405 [Cytophagaceae bacterium SCN 52-12]
MTLTSCNKREAESTVVWKTAGVLPSLTAREALGVAGPVSGFSGNRLLVAGGANFPGQLPWEGGTKKYYDDVYLFDPAQRDFFTDTLSLKLPYPVAYAGSATAGDHVFYAGGENEDGISDRVYRLQWTGTVLVTEALPALPAGVTNASLLFYKNALYVAGGETADKTSDKIWRLSLNQPLSGWKPLPPIPHPASHAVQVILRSRGQDYLYIIGGRCKNSNGISTIYETVYALNLETLEWQQKKPLPYPLAAGSGVAIPGVATSGVARLNDNALLLGGDKGTIFTRIETLLAKAAGLKGEARDSVIRQKNSLQATHPGFSREVLVYHSDTDEWEIAGEIPFTVPVTTAAVYREGKIYITSGEIKPGIRTPVILEGTIHPKPDPL